MGGFSWLEEGWLRLATSVSPFTLHTLFTFLIHEVAYWGTYVPYALMDRSAYFRKWKIQEHTYGYGSGSRHAKRLPGHDRMKMWRCVGYVAANHLFLVLPLILVTHPLFEMLGTTHSLPLPTVWEFGTQIFFCLLVEDVFFYFGHRLLHTPWLYRHVHSVHHQHTAPFGAAAEFAHPLEVVFLGLSTVAGPIIVGPHLFTLWGYLFLRCWQTVDCHSGYDGPWSLNRWVPIYGGARQHDHHHKTFSGNYASIFLHMDWFFGTDWAWRQSSARQRRQGVLQTEKAAEGEQQVPVSGS
ncbi:hypothetical protein CDCA_CDCA07G2090 [Cyanidium caldarium]|uniref:Fatty acid hydroxylase domain-containing protein n=1 Tax=Cyanidium caldarium TaxID=2771 RepID=A0AAV9IVD8_CYACA|nr:hypothetical protein CDCA_CDCA07G2090 [Cyanidium caldarium]